MEIASRTLREVEFRQQLRGYHQDDVDEFLERVAAGIEVLQDRLREANERATRAAVPARSPTTTPSGAPWSSPSARPTWRSRRPRRRRPVW
jgi:DivIVA domain-containing protein